MKLKAWKNYSKPREKKTRNQIDPIKPSNPGGNT